MREPCIAIFACFKDEFTVKQGDNGFGPNSSFELGLYRNIRWRGNSRCVASRVGRLTFQVGSRATQVITIDLGDFGKGGPITNDVRRC